MAARLKTFFTGRNPDEASLARIEAIKAELREDNVVKREVDRTWRGQLWDTLDKSPTERRFMLKLDASIVRFVAKPCSPRCSKMSDSTIAPPPFFSQVTLASLGFVLPLTSNCSVRQPTSFCAPADTFSRSSTRTTSKMVRRPAALPSLSCSGKPDHHLAPPFSPRSLRKRHEGGHGNVWRRAVQRKGALHRGLRKPASHSRACDLKD